MTTKSYFMICLKFFLKEISHLECYVPYAILKFHSYWTLKLLRDQNKNREGSLHYPWILLSMTHEDVFTYSYLAADKTKTAPDKAWVITELSWKLAPIIGVPVTVFMISHIWSTYPFKEWISSLVHRIPSSRKEGTTYICVEEKHGQFSNVKKQIESTWSQMTWLTSQQPSKP